MIGGCLPPDVKAALMATSKRLQDAPAVGAPSLKRLHASSDLGSDDVDMQAGSSSCSGAPRSQTDPTVGA
eukprot:11540195-Alexandrium_andersonii.AAC.1